MTVYEPSMNFTVIDVPMRLANSIKGCELYHLSNSKKKRGTNLDYLAARSRHRKPLDE